MANVFISYSSSDRLEALELFKLLGNNGCDVWMDYFDITPSARLEQQLLTNIKNADWVCLLLSPASVKSHWVENEVKKTQSLSLKLLGIIIHSCTIPDFIGDVVHIDARIGLSDAVIKSRILETITNKRLLTDEDKLNEGERLEIKKQEIRERADESIPLVKNKLLTVYGSAIKNLVLTLDKNAFPSKDISPFVYELNFSINNLFISPLKIFITAFCEGKTWPEGFKYPEPSYKEFYRNFQTRIVVQLDWCERSEKLTQVIDGTDFHNYLAEFNYKFDGKDLKEKKDWQNLQEKFEIQPLDYLIKNGSHFQFIEHDPTLKKERLINTEEIPFYIELKAVFPEEDNKSLTLFKSHHSFTEEVALTAGSFKIYKSDVEKTVILTEYNTLFTNQAQSMSRERENNIAETLQKNEEVSKEEQPFAARYLYSQGIYARFKGQNFDALKCFEKAVNYISPLVFEKFPTHVDIIILINSCDIITNLLKKDRSNLINPVMERMVAGAQRAVDLYPGEPEYKRILKEVSAKKGDFDISINK